MDKTTLKKRDTALCLRWAFQYVTLLILIPLLAKVGIVLLCLASFAHGMAIEMAWEEIDERLFPRS